MILTGLREVISAQIKFEVYLFGSRVDDQKSGGDIDLLLVVPMKYFSELSSNKHRIVAQAKKYIGEQRIDITLKALEDLDNDTFIRAIKSDLIKISEEPPT